MMRFLDVSGYVSNVSGLMFFGWFGMVCNGLGCWEPAAAPKWKEMVVRNSEKQAAVCLILIRAYIIRVRCTSHQATMRVNNPNCRLV